MKCTVREIENTLANIFDRKECILAGRGATALWGCYKLLPEARRKVLIPATMCLSPLYTLYYANCIPELVDVELSTATICLKALEKKLSSDSSIGAVLAVHLYGNPVDMERLCELCSKYQVLVIEDFAQCYGGSDSNGTLLGVRGDLAITSFGHTKIVDVGLGGAILTNNTEYALKLRNILSEVDCEASIVQHLSSLYSSYYYTAYKLASINHFSYTLFDNAAEIFKPLYFRTLNSVDLDKLRGSLKLIDEEINIRRRNFEIFYKKLSGNRLITVLHEKDLVLAWRFSILVPSKVRDFICEQLRSNRIDVSTWYPNLAWFIPEQRSFAESNFPNAQNIQQSVLNFWLGDDYNYQRIDEACDIIFEGLEKQFIEECD